MASAHMPLESSQVTRVDRRMVVPNIHLARTTLDPAQGAGFHWHRDIRDTLYVLMGQLTVSVLMPTDSTSRAYESVGGMTETIRTGAQGAQVHVLVLRPGDLITIHPKVVHAAFNHGNVPCDYLSLEGMGKLDFVAVPMPISQT